MSKKVLAVALLLFFSATFARADWSVGDPNIVDDDLLPKLSDGRALDITTYAIADDFYTVDDDDVTLSGIHIWASWKDGILPAGGAADVSFSVGIHENNGGEPGTLVWSGNFIAPTGGYLPRYFDVRSYNDTASFDWMHPSTAAVVTDGASDCYQYNLNFVDGAPSLEGDEHYWLVMKATAVDALLGWVEATENHWNNSRWGHGGPPWGSGGTMIVDNMGQPVCLSFTMTAAVPEPASYAMLLSLVVPLLLWRKLRGRRK